MFFFVFQGCTWADEHSGPFSWKTKVRTTFGLFAKSDMP